MSVGIIIPINVDKVKHTYVRMGWSMCSHFIMRQEPNVEADEDFEELAQLEKVDWYDIHIYIHICVCLLFPFLKCKSNLEFMAYLPSAASRSEVLRKPSWDHPGKTALVWKGSWSSVMTSKMPCRLGYLLMLHFPVLCILWNQHWYRWLYIYMDGVLEYFLFS